MRIQCKTGETANDYYEYLETTHWAETKKAAYRHHGMRCSECGSHKKLQMHHLSYENIGHESMEDLTPLCAECHTFTHTGKTDDPERIRLQHIIDTSPDIKRSLVTEYDKKKAFWLVNRSKYSKMLRRAILRQKDPLKPVRRKWRKERKPRNP